MNKQITIEYFKQLGIWRQCINNCMREYFRSGKSKFKSLDFFINPSVKDTSIISDAFHWANSKEGFDFWWEQSNAINKLIKKIN